VVLNMRRSIVLISITILHFSVCPVIIQQYIYSTSKMPIDKKHVMQGK
jgi:hypothetical protein